MSTAAAAPATAPYAFPSLTDIKRALPSQCFEASVPMSLYYTARSLLLAGGLAAGLAFARAQPLLQANAALDAALCTGYVLLQGIVFWGFFTVGHDCGHGAFSRSHALNFSVGTLMHSIILTPFESWKLSHRHHHKNTGNIDKDEIFYPQRRADDHALSRNLVRVVLLCTCSARLEAHCGALYSRCSRLARPGSRTSSQAFRLAR